MSEDSKRGKILIVEDEAGVADICRDFFREYGYDSEIAQDGIEAQELLKKEEFCLILTDVIFFQLGGIDLIRTIRERDSTTPIVVMTGYGPEVAQEAMEAGANAFVLKPFGIDQLKSEIEMFIDLDRLEKRFGIVAVEKRFITPHQLIEALKTQVMENVERGKHRRLGSILLDQGLITVPQIDDVLKSLGKGTEGLASTA